MLYLQLIDGYEKNNTDIQHYLRRLTFYIVPVLNPDGYIYSMSKDDGDRRLWRKNRRETNSHCKGVDLNRNFDFDWGRADSSKNPCRQIYRGKNAFSEVETSAVRDQINGVLKGQVDAFLTMHTYSQLWLHSYGHKRGEYPKDKEELVRIVMLQRNTFNTIAQLKVGKAASKALARRYNTKYRVGSAADLLCKCVRFA